MALVHPEHSPANVRRRHGILIVLGLFGAALLYGDGMITPAISVLSAVEGLEVSTPLFQPYVIPLTVIILVGLFLVQRRGTAGVGVIFGPITLLWFATLAVLGAKALFQHPVVLTAIDPVYCSCWGPSSSWSREARRSTPTWGTSEPGRSA
jgi:KUP system potassium uptake protein